MTIVYSALAVFFFVCYYFFFRRVHITFGVNSQNERVRTAELLAAMGLGAACVAMLWLAVFSLHLFAVALIVKLVDLIVRKMGREKYNRGFGWWKKLCGSGAVPLVVALCMIVYGLVNMMNIVETRYTVYTDKAIRQEGYSIALIADVHFGVSIDMTELKRVCDEISSKNTDMVVLCGDIVDESTTKSDMREMFNALGGIRSAYGVFYVYGNHDRLDMGVTAHYSEAELEQAIRDSGIMILRDDVFALNDEFTIVGREDRSWESRKQISTLLSDVDMTDFILTLDHQPNEYAENGKAGTDLLLSGHTHGGQLWPMNWVFKLISANDAIYGRTIINGGTQAIVTSGLAGWGFPIKTCAPAEYVIIDVKPKR